MILKINLLTSAEYSISNERAERENLDLPELIKKSGLEKGTIIKIKLFDEGYLFSATKDGQLVTISEEFKQMLTEWIPESEIISIGYIPETGDRYMFITMTVDDLIIEKK